MLLDACGALAADYTLVHRVITVAINISHLAIFEMHFDAAAASAHIAGCGFNLVPIFGAGVDLRLGKDSHVQTIANHMWFHYGPYLVRMWSQLLAILLSGTMVEPILQIGLRRCAIGLFI